MELRPQMQPRLFLPHQQQHPPRKTTQQYLGPVSCTQPSQGKAARLIARTGTRRRTEESPFIELQRSLAKDEPMSLQHVDVLPCESNEFFGQSRDNRPAVSNLKVCSSELNKSASKEEKQLSEKMYRSSVYILNKVSGKTHVKVCSQADLRQPPAVI